MRKYYRIVGYKDDKAIDALETNYYSEAIGKYNYFVSQRMAPKIFQNGKNGIEQIIFKKAS